MEFVFNMGYSKEFWLIFYDSLRHASSATVYQHSQIRKKRAQKNLIKSYAGTRYQKISNMKPKFFLKSAATSRGGPGPFQGPSSYSQLCW